MIRKHCSLVLTAALTLTASVVGPPFAFARTEAAISGRADNPADETCWSTYYAGKINNCGATRTLNIPATIDNSGSRSVTVTAQADTPSNNVGCVAVSLDNKLTSVWTSGPPTYLSTFGPAQDIVLGSVFTPSNGNLYAQCMASPGGRVYQIRFAP